jgi:hypothetical protein
MLLLKRQNLSTFILTIRTQISALQDTLYMSPHERCTSFPPFLIDVEPTPGTDRVNENVSEELLVAHEMECERLEAERGERKEVLERLEKWFGVVEEMRELEVSFIPSFPSSLPCPILPVRDAVMEWILTMRVSRHPHRTRVGCWARLLEVTQAVSCEKRRLASESSRRSLASVSLSPISLYLLTPVL